MDRVDVSREPSFHASRDVLHTPRPPPIRTREFTPLLHSKLRRNNLKAKNNSDNANNNNNRFAPILSYDDVSLASINTPHNANESLKHSTREPSTNSGNRRSPYSTMPLKEQERQHQELRNENFRLKMTIYNLERVLRNRLPEDMHQLLLEKTAIEAKHQELEAEYSRLQAGARAQDESGVRLEQLKTESADLRRQVEDLDYELGRARDDKTELQRQLDQIKDIGAGKEDLEYEMRSLQAQLDEERHSRSRAEAELQSARSEMDQALDEAERLEVRLEQMQQEAQTRTDNEQSLQSKLDQIRTENDRLQQAANEARTENIRLQQEARANEPKHTQTMSQLDRAQQQVASLQQDKARLEREVSNNNSQIQARLELALQQVSSLQQDKTRLESELGSSLPKVAAAERKVALLEDDNERLQQANKLLQEELNGTIPKNSVDLRLASIKEDNARLKQHAIELQAEIESARSSHNQVQHQLHEALEQAQAALQKEARRSPQKPDSNLADQLDIVQRQKRALEGHLQDWQVKAKRSEDQLASANQLLNRCNADVVQLRAENVQLRDDLALKVQDTDRIVSLEGQLKEAKAQNSQDADRIISLERQLRLATLDHHTEASGSEKLGKQLEAQLSSLEAQRTHWEAQRSHYETQLSNLETQLSNLETQLSKCNRDLQDRDDEVVLLLVKHSELQRQLDTSLLARQQQVDSGQGTLLKSQVSALESDLARLQARHDSESQETQERLSDQDQEIKALKTQLRKAEVDLSNQRQRDGSEVESQTKEVQTLKQALDRAEVKAQEYRREVQDLRDKEVRTAQSLARLRRRLDRRDIDSDHLAQTQDRLARLAGDARFLKQYYSRQIEQFQATNWHAVARIGEMGIRARPRRDRQTPRERFRAVAWAVVATVRFNYLLD